MNAAHDQQGRDAGPKRRQGRPREADDRAVLDLIARRIAEGADPPNYAEMVAVSGVTTKGAITHVVRRLERDGFLRRIEGRDFDVAWVRLPGGRVLRPKLPARLRHPPRTPEELRTQLVRLSRAHGWDQGARLRHGKDKAADLAGIAPRTLDSYLEPGSAGPPQPVARLLWACDQRPDLVPALERARKLPATTEALRALLIRLSHKHGWDADPRWVNGQVQAAKLAGVAVRTMQDYLDPATAGPPPTVARLLWACERDPQIVALLAKEGASLGAARS